MMKRRYKDENTGSRRRRVIAQVNEICDELAAQNFTPTLRQVYYQMVVRQHIPNEAASYNRFKETVNHGRYVGLIDWSHIMDAGRWLRELAHWDSPQDLIDSSVNSYRRDKWSAQQHRLEIWIEKDALLGIIQPICQANDVPYFSLRGYGSSSALWDAAHHRFREYLLCQQEVTVLHIGDHDPTGWDVTRSIREVMTRFIRKDAEVWAVETGHAEVLTDFGDWFASRFHVGRLALNIEQVEARSLDANPVKHADIRSDAYVEYMESRGYAGPERDAAGKIVKVNERQDPRLTPAEQCWEVDALPPAVFADLIRGAIARHRDDAVWDASEAAEDQERATVRAVAERWDEVQAFLAEGHPPTV